MVHEFIYNGMNSADYGLRISGEDTWTRPQPDVKRIEADRNGKKDFSGLIALAKTCKAPEKQDASPIRGGYGHAQLFGFADRLAEAMISGAVSRIVVVAGDNLLGVSTKVQRKVLAAVKDIIGCDLSRVNIQISDVRGLSFVALLFI